MKARHIYIIGMAALTLTGCMKDELFDTPHPGKGSITVTADWSARGEGIATPESWNLSMGDYHGTETAATHAPDYLFEPGSYSLVAWKPPPPMRQTTFSSRAVIPSWHGTLRRTYP